MPNYIALPLPFFFLLIGVELWVARKRRAAVYRLNDALVDLSCGITQQICVVFFAAALLGAYVFVYERFRLVSFPGGSPWPWVIAVLAVDFIYYWWHRLSHEVNLLWAAHVVHHQSEDFNFAVALRQSLTTSWTSFPFYIPPALRGVGLVPFATATALSLLYQFWIHTELVPRLPRFELLFNSPSAHRVHPGVHAAHLDKTYGRPLLIWDRLFGTFEPETEAVVYGVTKPLKSFNALWAQLAGYV